MGFPLSNLLFLGINYIKLDNFFMFLIVIFLMLVASYLGIQLFQSAHWVFSCLIFCLIDVILYVNGMTCTSALCYYFLQVSENKRWKLGYMIRFSIPTLLMKADQINHILFSLIFGSFFLMLIHSWFAKLEGNKRLPFPCRWQQWLYFLLACL